MNAPKRQSIHKTTHIEFFKLCEWIKTANLEGVHTIAGCAKKAAEVCGFHIAESAIQNALTATGVKLPERPADVQKRDRTEFLAQELVKLQRSLGQEPSGELLNIANMPAAA